MSAAELDAAPLEAEPVLELEVAVVATVLGEDEELQAAAVARTRAAGAANRITRVRARVEARRRFMGNGAPVP
jgi:hypothetical protein